MAKGLRDRALLLLGFAGAFRRSELVALDVAMEETEGRVQDHQGPSKGRTNLAHSTAKCNTQSLGVGENLARCLIAEYLSRARVEFILDPLDIGIRQHREV